MAHSLSASAVAKHAAWRQSAAQWHHQRINGSIENNIIMKERHRKKENKVSGETAQHRAMAHLMAHRASRNIKMASRGSIENENIKSFCGASARHEMKSANQ